MSRESAWGRPASWWSALPAVVVGCCALALAAYGRWALPPQLPQQYVQHLERSAAEYADAQALPNASGATRWLEIAGQRDVIFRRLTSLEADSPQRYWTWAGYLDNHARALRQRLLDPTVSISPDLRAQFETQAEQFRSKSREILDQLAAGNSELRAAALLRLVEDEATTGMGQLGVDDASHLAAELKAILTGPEARSEPPSNESRRGAPLTENQRNEARLLLVNLLVEAAWNGETTSKLTCDQSEIDEAWRVLNQLEAVASEDAAPEIRWAAIRQLIDAYRQGSDTPANRPVATFESTATANIPEYEQRTDWRQLAEIQLASLAGDWQAVEELLTGAVDNSDPVVVTTAARTICRLASAPRSHTSEAWSRNSEAGILLVAQRAPHLPEFAELLWACAMSFSDSAGQSIVAPTIPSAIVEGQSSPLKHTIFAVAATIDEQSDVARTHLQLLKGSGGNLQFVARVALWRGQAQSPATAVAELENLQTLMIAATELEPESGLNWLVLGMLQLRLQRWDASATSLDKAERLLGRTSAIEEMRDAIRQAAGR